MVNKVSELLVDCRVGWNLENDRSWSEVDSVVVTHSCASVVAATTDVASCWHLHQRFCSVQIVLATREEGCAHCDAKHARRERVIQMTL